MSLKNRVSRLEQLIAETEQEMPDPLTPEERARYDSIAAIHKKADIHDVNYLQSPEFREWRHLFFKLVEAEAKYRTKHFGRHAYDGLAEAINAGRERARQRILQNAKKGDVNEFQKPIG